MRNTEESPARFVTDVAPPPAPAWFVRNLEERPAQSYVRVAAADIEMLCWGERGRPGVLLIHGSRAHAHWWSPIAPFLARRWRVAAFSLSGMGGSGWRPSYSASTFAEEARSVAEAAGLFEAGPPVVVAHSFGGTLGLEAAVQFGDRLAGLVICDTLLRPETPGFLPPPPRGEHRIYPTLQAALERFRLSPEQECANPYYLDWIAHHSVRRATEAEAARAGGSPGWTWRFDPGLFQKVAFKNHWRQLRQTRCPMALVRGARSSLVPQEAWLEQQAHAAQGATFHDITDAAHHLMLDQPLAFTAKIEALCGDWLDGPGSHS